MVSFALRSARIFFRTDFSVELIPKDKEDSVSVVSEHSATTTAAASAGGGV